MKERTKTKNQKKKEYQPKSKLKETKSAQEI